MTTPDNVKTSSILHKTQKVNSYSELGKRQTRKWPLRIVEVLSCLQTFTVHKNCNLQNNFCGLTSLSLSSFSQWFLVLFTCYSQILRPSCHFYILYNLKKYLPPPPAYQQVETRMCVRSIYRGDICFSKSRYLLLMIIHDFSRNPTGWN